MCLYFYTRKWCKLNIVMPNNMYTTVNHNIYIYIYIYIYLVIIQISPQIYISLTSIGPCKYLSVAATDFAS